MRVILGAIFGTILAAAASAQTTPAFDVASVRVTQGTAGREGMHGMPASIKTEPGTVTMRSATFRNVVRWAYNVVDFQVTGPDWIDQQRYDIVAKAPGGASEEQLRAMMQTLLAERFKLTSHRQTKEAQAWVLSVGKNGPKFKESASEGESSIVPDQKRMVVAVQRTQVSQLVDFLAPILRAPVLDETGLKGRYDITIAVDKYIPDHATAIVDMVSIIVNGIQQELGLKLEQKKMPVDFVVVDRAEMTPAEN
jgi:uncharacterized protein (TIGR03435 family)